MTSKINKKSNTQISGRSLVVVSAVWIIVWGIYLISSDAAESLNDIFTNTGDYVSAGA